MKLTLNDIKSITHGAVKITENDGKFNFFRFSDEQYEFYLATNQSFAGKALCTASVILDFYTDASALAMSIEAKKTGTRNYCNIDIYEDGVLISHKGEDEAETETAFNVETTLKSVRFPKDSQSPYPFSPLRMKSGLSVS